MNEEFIVGVETRITKYLDAIESTSSHAGDFVLEQTPLVVQEFLNWYFYSHLVYGLTWLFFSLIFGVVSLVLWKKFAEDDALGTMMAISISTMGFLFIMFVVNAISVVKVTTAPRLILLEKVGELIS